ncbi:hypothetical protein NQZ68_033783 [Dissostichus eleginoides]|nr:hypothetical protein NQZ68_033783 [Dissostichus eleginoides]
MKEKRRAGILPGQKNGGVSFNIHPRADPLTPFDDLQAKGLLSGGQRALPRAGRRGVSMVTVMAEEWQGGAFRRRGVTVDRLSRDGMFLGCLRDSSR